MHFLTFRKAYFFLALLLFIVEVLISLFFRDRFIRPILGDVLVVFLMYCCARAFLNFPEKTTMILVMIIAFFIEALQYFNLVKLLGLEGVRIAEVVIGLHFDWRDLVAYAIGAFLAYVLDMRTSGQSPNQPNPT